MPNERNAVQRSCSDEPKTACQNGYWVALIWWGTDFTISCNFHIGVCLPEHQIHIRCIIYQKQDATPFESKLMRTQKMISRTLLFRHHHTKFFSTGFGSNRILAAIFFFKFEQTNAHLNAKGRSQAEKKIHICSLVSRSILEFLFSNERHCPILTRESFAVLSHPIWIAVAFSLFNFVSLRFHETHSSRDEKITKQQQRRNPCCSDCALFVCG